MILYSDGFCKKSFFKSDVGNNGSGNGGYRVCDQEGKTLAFVELPGQVTSNEAELRGLVKAIELAGEKDTIIVDSTIAAGWISKGRSIARADLNMICFKAKLAVQKKKLRIEWLPREHNLAGQINEFGKLKTRNLFN